MNSYDLILGHGTTICDPSAGTITPLSGSTVLSVAPSMLRNGGSKYHGELQYLGLLKELVDLHDVDPTPREDRTGTGTFSVFGRQIRFDLQVGLPILTSKEVKFKPLVAELVWMLSGSTNINDLDAKIWDEWADENGNLGPVYGKQWRAWEGVEGHIDQMADVIAAIKHRPNDRGHVVSAWNVADIPAMHLRPCHCLFQFYVQDGTLSCQLYQRSADIFLGVPFNIASYAILTHLVARECGLEVGEFVHTFGDLHLYNNHVAQAKEQLTRTPTPFPHLSIDPIAFSELGIFGIQPGHFSLENYNPSEAIKAEVSV